MISGTSSLHTTNFESLKLWRRGKVRDVYDLEDSLLIVTTDRISAYDVIMDQAIPGKGIVLSTLSAWWFEQLSPIIESHYLSSNVDEFPDKARRYSDALQGRSMLVKKSDPIPIECVARGYLAGSGWREYLSTGSVCGVPLPSGLRLGSKLPKPIFTPATKAEEGHDENISFEQTVNLVGPQLANQLRDLTLKLYEFGATVSEDAGLILADTKFEFGICDGSVILIDEALTPDSSRFWLASDYEEGEEPVNFDKQYLRDWLDTLDWDKSPPPPTLPKEVIEGTIERYVEAFNFLTSYSIDLPTINEPNDKQ